MRLCINVDDAVILLVGERSLARKQLTLCIISKVVTVNCSFGTPFYYSLERNTHEAECLRTSSRILTSINDCIVSSFLLSSTAETPC